MTGSSQSQLTWSSSTEPGSLGARGGSTGLGPASTCPSSSVSSNEILATEADLSSLCLLGAQLSVLVEVECFLFLFEMEIFSYFGIFNCCFIFRHLPFTDLLGDG